MRRPAPLPAQPEQKSSTERPARRDRTAPGDVAERDPVVTPLAPKQDEDRGSTASDDLVGAATEGEVLFTQRDVWRAARARRKALKSEIRRFTQRSRRRRMIWWGALGSLALLVGGSALAAYSPLFAVEEITVVGASTLDPEVIEEALSDQVGTPLALVDASEVKAALMAFPLIETYALEAKPPHELTVRIVERTPIGVIASDAGYTLVDAAGVVLSTTDSQPEGQPLLEIDGGTDSAAFEAAGLVVRSLPDDLRSRLTRVQASSADDVTLTLGDITVVWGSAEDSGEKVLALEGLIAAAPDAKSFDVSSPDVGIVG